MLCCASRAEVDFGVFNPSPLGRFFNYLTVVVGL